MQCPVAGPQHQYRTVNTPSTHAALPTTHHQVAAVVSQPGKPKGRGNKATPVPSPVEQLARQHLPDDAILCPRSAKDVRSVWGMARQQCVHARWPCVCTAAARASGMRALQRALVTTPKRTRATQRARSRRSSRPLRRCSPTWR
jgi:hypothetical protein